MKKTIKPDPPLEAFTADATRLWVGLQTLAKVTYWLPAYQGNPIDKAEAWKAEAVEVQIQVEV